MATAKRRTTGNRASASGGAAGGGTGGFAGGWPRANFGKLGAHLLLLALIGVGVIGVFYKEPVTGYSTAAASYAARTACSCRFLAGRELAQCRTDLEPGMGMVFLTEDSDARTVTARVPLLASETARYAPASGCVLDAWEG